jgi:dethiobiotin synthetase
VITYFVTGTDTGVGKTFLAAALLTHARARGLRTHALKPAETGCARATDGELLPADGMLLRAAAGDEDLPIDTVVPHRYEAPVAPAVAARREGRPFSLERTLAAARALAATADLLVIEGAGGLLVPYGDDLLAADLAVRLGAPLLVVARAGLGTINHSLLTVFEARRRGLQVAAVLLNAISPMAADPSIDDNAAEIHRVAGVPVHGPGPIDLDFLL